LSLIKKKYPHLFNQSGRIRKIAPLKVKQLYFIEQAKIVHGERYNYSLVRYADSGTDVTIVCNIHGSFNQKPAEHQRGSGCLNCSGKKKLTTEQVIRNFKKIHGDRYDYSKVEYKNSRTKVSIICAEHGIFKLRTDAHNNNRGCSKCSKPTTEEIITAFKKEHGTRYDYSKVKFTNSHSPVTIICPTHGEFKQSIYNHKNGSGCHSCSGHISPTTAELIVNFRQTHGARYDYSKVEYSNSKDTVTIICLEHGEFEQIPRNHIKGANCHSCTGKKSPTTKELIAEFVKVHGDKYDYSKVNYINSQTPVTIICPEKGEFEQLPISHKKGYKHTGKNNPTTKDIIVEFRKIHGNRYNYSKVNYNGSYEPITIICPVHGEFKQLPVNHKNGANCLHCTGKRLTTEKVIASFKSFHGEQYDYSKVKYVNSDTKVTIICPKHGEFEQLHSDHRRGVNCPKCVLENKTGFHSIHTITKEQAVSDNGLYIMLLTSPKKNQWLKVGTSQPHRDRCGQISKESGYEVVMISYHPMIWKDALELELSTHKSLNEYSELPCTYFTGYTECFSTKAVNLLLKLDLLTPKQYKFLQSLIV